MTRVKKFFIGVAVFVLIPFWLPVVLGSLGYYVNTPGWKAAEMIIGKKRPATSCRMILIMPWRIFSPGTSDQRISCIHEYAKLTKDPATCALIMPSDYGLSCINQSMDLVFRESSDKTAEHVDVNSNTDCGQYNSSELHKDYCFFSIAHLTRKTADCEPIQNETIKKACIMKFEAWEKYPELRVSSFFGVNLTSKTK